MNRLFLIVGILGIFLLSLFHPAQSSGPIKEDRVLSVTGKMRGVFQEIEDYTSEVEQIYFKDGVEDQRSRFKYSFKKPNKIRIDFTYPHSGMIIYYRRGDKRATLRPFPSFPSLKFSFSIDSSIIKTPTGQQISQTDMIFFIDFLFRNQIEVPQEDSQFQEGLDQVNFLFWARDYVKGKLPEKYRIFISTQNWFPTRIERYSSEGRPIEISIIRNYVINSHLEDSFFTP